MVGNAYGLVKESHLAIPPMAYATWAATARILSGPRDYPLTIVTPIASLIRDQYSPYHSEKSDRTAVFMPLITGTLRS